MTQEPTPAPNGATQASAPPNGRAAPPGRHPIRKQPEPHRDSSDSSDDLKPWHTEGLPDKKPDDQNQPPQNFLRTGGWRFWVSALLLLVLLFAAVTWFSNRNKPPAISYNEFTTQLTAGNVKSVHSTGDSIDGDLKTAVALPDSTDGQTYTTFTTERPSFADDDLLDTLLAQKVEIMAAPVYSEPSIWSTLASAILPWIILMGLVYWLMRRMTKGGGLGGLGMSREVKPVEKEKVRVNFTDVAGIDEVKSQVSEIVDFLKNPERYRRVGAHAPKGVLLEGEPGTGKTLLARATAGEANVPFFSASASEFIEMIVGVGAQRVRQLFDEARKAAPSIIFIDEIDAIGRSRGSSRSFGGGEEREQTLNQVLTEMDGFDGTEGIVVMAATNRADVLDAALTRPGRFDRVITVSSPDLDGREQILEVHTRQIPKDADVKLRDLAAATPGMTGADLANLANEAALLAAQRADTKVYQRDFMNALEKIQLGVARSVIIPEDERRRTAYHESGHALLGMLQKGADPVRKVSIIPRGQALGVTLSTPDTDKYGYDEEYLRGRIVGALGGMAAEDAIFGVVTTGAESDLRQATGIARQMVGRWGMSEKVGPVYVLSDQIDPRTEGIAENTLDMVDEEVRRIIGECQQQAVQLLKDHRDQLEAIATALLEHETLDEDQVYAAAGIERPKSDVTMTKIRANPAQPSGLNGGPTPVPDAPWAPPDPGQLIGA
ncbi:MAG: ATP-dependent zinc metalloprotease FtsH [Propionibacteriaceae bacterium]|nr:ATP-dependent zinc metalloprotease FtsH [Propionibacteriaceae bacterium]